MSGGATADAVDGRRGPPALRRTLGIALVATLSRPAAWPLALAAFLLRGGIVVFALPLIVLPTPTGLGTIIAPLLFRLVIGRPDTGALAVVGALVGLLGAWLVLGGLLAAACEATLVRWAARDLAALGGEPARAASEPSRRRPWTPARVMAVRAIAHVPFALALAWAVPALVAAVYAELETPSDVTLPLAWRVLPHVVVPLALAGLAWILGQVVAALGVRALVLDDRGVGAAVAGGARSVARHLLAIAAVWLLGALGTVVLVVPTLAAAAFAWEQVRRVLPEDPAALLAVGSVLLLVATWSFGLFLAAVAAAWRATWWTAEWVRRRAPARRPVVFGESEAEGVRVAG